MRIGGTLGVTSTAAFDGGGLAVTSPVVVDEPLLALPVTSTVSRVLIMAYLSQVLKVRAWVYLDGDLVSPVGEITVTDPLDAAVMTAQFTIVDKRCQITHPETLAFGDHRVQIDVAVGPPGGMQRLTLFKGHTEGLQTDGAIQDRGTFVCATDTSTWADSPGCVVLGAFSGLRRGEVLALHALSSGARIVGLEHDGSRRLTKPQDIKGGSTFQLAMEWAPAERWRLRVSDTFDALEIVQDPWLETSPFCTITAAAQSGDPKEQVPTRPVTKMFLSGTRMTDAVNLDGQTTIGPIITPTSDGHTETVYTLDAGVEIYRQTKTFRNVETPGVTPAAAAEHLVRIDEITQHWNFGFFGAEAKRRATTMWQRVTKVQEETGVLAGDNGTTYVWTGSVTGRYTTPSAFLTETETRVEWFEYDAGACSLSKTTTYVYRPYAPLTRPGYSGAYLYSDGTWRANPFYWADSFYTRMLVETSTAVWTDGRRSSPPQVVHQKRALGYNLGFGVAEPTFAAANGIPLDKEFPFEWDGVASPVPSRIVLAIDKFWLANESNTQYTLTTNVRNFTSGVLVATDSGPDLIPGILPGPPSASPDVPQFQQQIMEWTSDLTDFSRRTERMESPGSIPWAEDLADLAAIGETEVRQGLEGSITNTHRPYPRMRPGRRVPVRTRGGRLANAYTGTVVHHIDPINARYMMETSFHVRMNGGSYG